MKHANLLLPMLAACFLCGCASTETFVRGNPKLDPRTYRPSKMSGLHLGMSKQEVVDFFGEEPASTVASDDGKEELLTWYGVVTTFKTSGFFTEAKDAYSSLWANCKFANGNLVGFSFPKSKTDVGAGSNVEGILSFHNDEEIAYRRDKNLYPLVSMDYNRKRGRRYFFNDELRLCATGPADREVDYWKDGLPVFKELPCPFGFTRYRAINSEGRPVYFDLPPGCTYTGFWDDAFHWKEPPNPAAVQAALNFMNQTQQTLLQPAPVVAPTPSATPSSGSGGFKANYKRQCGVCGTEYDIRYGCPTCKAGTYSLDQKVKCSKCGFLHNAGAPCPR